MPTQGSIHRQPNEPASAASRFAGPALTLGIFAAAILAITFVMLLPFKPATAAPPMTITVVVMSWKVSFGVAVTGLVLGIVSVIAARRDPARTAAPLKPIMAVSISAAALIICLFVIVTDATSASPLVTAKGQLPVNKDAEIANLLQIGNAMIAYSDDNRGRLPPVPTKLVSYTSRAEFQFVMAGTLGFDPAAIPMTDIELPPDLLGYAAVMTEEIPVGAYRFGGFWFVVNQSFDLLAHTEILAFSRRIDETQSGRGVLFGDGHAEWLSETDFRARLVGVNDAREKRRLQPIEPDD